MLIPQEHIDKLASLFQSGKVDYIRQGIQIWETLYGELEDFCNLLNVIATKEVVSPNDIPFANSDTVAKAFQSIGTSVETRSTTILWAICTLANLSSTFKDRLKTLQLKNVDFTLFDINLVSLTSVTTVSWTNASLTTVPDTILQLTNLQKLDLQGNRIDTLPEWLDLLPDL